MAGDSHHSLYTRENMLRFRRLYSSISELHRSVQELPTTKNVIQNIPVAFQNLKPEETSEVHSILKTVQQHEAISDSEKRELVNEILYHGLPYDYSLFFTVNKGKEPHHWTVGSLSKLVEANPGRVDQSWDLLQKFGTNHIAGDRDISVLYKAVLEKLIFGEKVEIREDDIEMNLGRLSRALYLSEKCQQVSDDIVRRIVELLSEHKVIQAIHYSGIESKQLLVLLNDVSFDNEVYVTIFQKIFTEEPALLDKESLCKGLTLALNAKREADDKAQAEAGEVAEPKPKKESSRVTEISENIGVLGTDVSSIVLNSDYGALADSVIAFIEENHLDTDNSAESLLVRMKLVEVYGMDKGDVQTSLSKFHEYQGRNDKFGIEFVQHKLINVFCFQAINEHNEHYLKIAQTLMTMENTPIKILQSLILARAEFDTETESAALDLYNEYINNVSKKVNEVTKRSGSGQLTEAMVLGSLYSGDREFGLLLFDKAVENKIISDELEIATIKKVFKVYGDAYAEDSWEVAKAYLKKYVLNYIRKL